MKSSIKGAWYRKERAEHHRALASPQSFPLSGDGFFSRLAYKRQDRDPAVILAEARYRDWRYQRDTRGRE